MQGTTSNQAFEDMSDDELRQALEKCNARSEEIKAKQILRKPPSREQQILGIVSENLLRPKFNFENLRVGKN